MFAREVQGAVGVVTASTALIGDVVDELIAAVHRDARPGKPMIVLDLRGVPHVDSRGLECLLDLQDELRARGGELRLATPAPLVADVLRATRLADRFRTFPTLKAAVGSFSS